MDLLERIGIERECERLIVRMAHIGDLESPLAVIDLYTEDGIWESPELKTRREGKEANRIFAQKLYGDGDVNARGAHRHFISNVQIDVEDSSNATGLAYWIFYHDNNGPDGLKEIAMMGQYRDRFRKTGDGWRLAHRIVEVSAGGLPQSPKR
jgi:ketosteroid isomerase-like protein